MNLQRERDEEWEVEECDEAGEAEEEADELEAEFVSTEKAGEDGGVSSAGCGGGGAVALRPHTDGMLLPGGHVQILKKFFVQCLYTGNLVGH